MNPYTELLSLLSSPSSRFYCEEGEMTAAILSVIPFFDRFHVLDTEFPLYAQRVQSHIDTLIASVTDTDIHVTSDYASEDVQPGSLAYYPVMGMIMAQSDYWFSSQRFQQNLIASEANPNINAHFLHIRSGGGEAWYLDKVAETLSSLNKPVYTLVEKICASAAYYIGVHGSVIKSLTQNDTIGSIGTMVDGWDLEGYFEKMGLRSIRALATRSDLKNKKHQDLRTGKPEQFIREELDPLQQQFEAAIRRARPQLNALPDDDPVFRGETFSAAVAVGKPLIDGFSSLPEALAEADHMGKDWADKNLKRNSLLSYL